MRADVKYTIVLAGIFTAFFGGIAALWISGHTEFYFAIMHGLGVDAFSRPFLDLSGVLAMGECHRLGIDPTAPNLCDPLHRILPYGPAVLHEPFVTADVNWLGAVQSLLFLTAVVLVSRPRTWAQLLVMAFASLSSGVLYALERGNFDLIEFLLLVTGVFIAMRGPLGRLGSYLLFLAGGTAKFYPFALLLTIARERLAVAVGLATVSLALIATYLMASRSILAKLSIAVPFSYNGGVFGAVCLPFGLIDWLKLPRYAGHLMMAVLAISFGTVAWRIFKRLRATCQPADLQSGNAQVMIAGAIVLTSCFLMGPSISYRSVFLLLLLPGAFELARLSGLRRWTGCVIAAVLCCLWSELIRQWGEAGIDLLQDVVAPDQDTALWGDAPSIIFFVCRELLWWWLVAVMIAIVALFLSYAQSTRKIGHLLGDREKYQA